MSRFFSTYFTITGVKKVVWYTEDFVILRFVISRFHCTFKRVLEVLFSVTCRQDSRNLF